MQKNTYPSHAAQTQANNRNIQITLSPFSPGSPGFPGTPWKTAPTHGLEREPPQTKPHWRANPRASYCNERCFLQKRGSESPTNLCFISFFRCLQTLLAASFPVLLYSAFKYSEVSARMRRCLRLPSVRSVLGGPIPLQVPCLPDARRKGQIRNTFISSDLCMKHK